MDANLTHLFIIHDVKSLYIQNDHNQDKLNLLNDILILILIYIQKQT